MAEGLPPWVNSDHLTLLGFAAQLATGICYALAVRDRRMLLAAIVCLAVNWFGDSLDGTLARVRQKQRPRYGFYVDHMLDSLGAVAMMSGLALSGYMHPLIAIGLLIAFLLLSIQSYLATYTLGEFHLSFWRFGPTELRILLAIGNVASFRWAWVMHRHYRLFDVGGAIGLVVMAAMVIVTTLKNTARLYREERIG
jgi:phosphatidylglycerophosphate synthase